MMKFSSRLLFTFATFTWLIIGTFLLTFGIYLEVTALHTPYIASEEPFSLLAFLMPTLGTTKENALIALVCTALFIGYFKGKYVLRKSAQRQITQILSLPAPYSITALYTKKYLLLILSMMALGMALRFLPIHSDLRGFIDIAIGSALIQGATHFFPVIRNSNEP